jgi:hypothetical protein
VEIRAGFFRFLRASTSACGISFSRSTSARSRVFAGAYGRSRITNAEPVIPEE